MPQPDAVKSFLNRPKAMVWFVAVGAVILGIALLKAIADSRAKIYRCPYCNLVIKKNQATCPRCRRSISWGGI